MNQSLKILIIAGEKSGDNHGASLMQAIKAQSTNTKFIGIGGEKMRQLGLHSIVDLDQMAVMGFWEVFKKILFFLNLKKKIINLIKTEKPEKIILIDYPGFNLNIAKKIKKNFSTSIYYYISPQIWAWKEKRINIIKKYIDKMIVIFPFELDWYKKRGVDVDFVGHPILDQIKNTNKDELIKKLNLDPNKLILGIFPGSRNQEFVAHINLILESIKIIKKELSEIQVVLCKAPEVSCQLKKTTDDSILICDNSHDVLSVSDFAIVASGTITIEAAVFNCPMLIVYKMSFISWILTNLFVKTPYAGMVNIIANEKIAPELIQSEMKPENIARITLIYLTNNNTIKNTQSKLKRVTMKLGLPGASNKAAEIILNSA